MRVVLAVVGKPKHAGLAAAVADYESRAARYWPLEIAEVREESARGGVGDAAVREREGERLEARLPAGAHVVACDPGGESMTSERFSAWLQQLRERGRDAAFVIGGAFGLSDALRARAATRLSLAPWTLPHELARLVLAEQLYRAGTLVRGEPYHK
jgi:23S rRNA (pseudouridine1915-N3)-methyltransferase